MNTMATHLTSAREYGINHFEIFSSALKERIILLPLMFDIVNIKGDQMEIS